MLNLFLLLYIIRLVICEDDLSVWKYQESVICSINDTYMTSLVYFPAVSQQFITYNNNSDHDNYIYNAQLNKKSNISITLSPSSILINNLVFILLPENTNINKIYYYIKSNTLYLKEINIDDIANITSLKGMEFSNSKYFFVSLIGTKYINYYYYDINNKNDYILKLKESYNFYNKIIGFFGVSSSSSNTYVHLYFYLNETTTIYSIYEFSGEIFTEKLRIFFNNKNLFNTTEISRSFSNEKSFLIFSYNKNDTNFYFYNYNYSDMTYALLKNYGNKYNFWPFRNATIISAFFLNNTEYLYYLIKKDKYYYAGVFDMENNLIIFNIQKDLIEFISVQDFNLVYGINNEIYMVCPFNSNDTTICNFSLSNQFIKISNDSINKYSTYCSRKSYYIIGRNCFEYVPFGYTGYTIDDYKYIEKCKVFDIDLKQCLDICDDNKIYDSINGMCYSCGPFNQYKNFELNKCVEDCSIYGLYPEPKYFTCSDCHSRGYYKQNGICVEECDPYYVIDNNTFLCINCQNETMDTPFYQDNECVKECNKNYIINYESKACLKCPNSKPYNQNNICVNECKQYYVIDDFHCYNCTEAFGDDYYFYNNTCVKKCPNYTIADDINKICNTCEELYIKSQFFEDGKCVEDCSEFHIKFSEKKICLKCKDIEAGLYFQDDLCVKKCDEYYSVDNNEKICINCSSYNNTMLQDNKCVDKCSPGYVNVYEPSYVCYNCYNKTKGYEFNGQCIDICPINTLVNELEHYCYSCKKGLFFDLKTKSCVETCEEFNEIDNENFICKDCLYYHLFYNNITKKCVEKCTNGTVAINNICELCDIYDEKHQKCMDGCPNEKYPFYLESKNDSFCFNCFCGYGSCLPNYEHILNENEDNIIDKSYTCDCPNNTNNVLVFGKYCQYKEYPEEEDIVRIIPMQDYIHINKRNAFTFELIINENEKNNSLRYLSTLHEQNIERRMKNKIMWILNEKLLVENNAYLIVEPGILITDYENQIKLMIYDNKDNIIVETDLYINTKSIDLKDYEIKINNDTRFYPMTENLSPKINIKDLNEENDKNNYILNYKYIDNEGEEFSLTGYIKNNYKYNELIMPFSEKIKIEIKNDYNDIVSKEYDVSFYYLDEYNKTLSNIIIKYDINNITKNINGTLHLRQLLNELKDFFNQCKNFELSKEENNLNLILNIIGTYLPLTIKNENNNFNYVFFYENEDEKSEIIESNYFLSLLNQIALFVFNITENEKIEKNNVYMKIINIIHNSLSDNKINTLNEETILSFLRTIDNIITIMNKNNSNINYNFKILFDDLNLLKNIISKNILSGYKLKIVGNNFNFNIIKPNLYIEEFVIQNEQQRNNLNNANMNYTDEFMRYKNYKLKYELITKYKNKCNNQSIFCISSINYDFLYDEITYLKNEKIANVLISISQYFDKNNNNISIYNTSVNNILNYSFITQIKIENSTNKNIKNFRYKLSYDFPMEYEKNKSDIICLALNSIINVDNGNDISISKEKNCLTYFDMEYNKVICDCNIDGEILIVLDEKLADLSKKIQFMNNGEKKIINSLSGSIILSTLALIAIFSVFLIKVDSYEDKINKKLDLENKTRKVKYEYQYFINLKDTGIYSFALHLTYYKYSFFNIMSIYRFYHPRYIRFNIEIIKILLNLLLSIYPYYNKHFEEKEQLINERNIYNTNKDITNLPIKFSEQILSFLFSLIASIIIWFIAQIFIKLLEFKNIRKKIWKPKEKILREYAFNSIKKFTNFNKKFKKVKKAMIAYTKICGKNIIDKKDKDKRKDKYTKYLEEKKILKNKMYVLNNNKYSKKKTKTELAILPDIPGIDINILDENLLYKEEEQQQILSKPIPINKSNNIINDGIKKEKDKNNLDINTNNINNTKLGLNVIKIDDFFILSNNSSSSSEQMKIINIIYNFEIIKNKYIVNANKIKDKPIYFDTNVMKYIDLEVQTLKNLSYIPSNTINRNQIINIDFKSKVFMTVFVNVLLFIILIIVDIFIIIIFNNIYQEYENRIISSWLIPVIIQITITNCLINYLLSLFCTFLLFKYYGKRKEKSCIGFIFNLFIEKYMLYFYKIRMLIKKYSFQYSHI